MKRKNQNEKMFLLQCIKQKYFEAKLKAMETFLYIQTSYIENINVCLPTYIKAFVIFMATYPNTVDTH